MMKILKKRIPIINKKYIRYLIIMIFSITFSITSVKAADNLATCSYRVLEGKGSNQDWIINYKYNVTKDTFDQKLTGKAENIVVDIKKGLTRDNLINSDGNLFCPEVYVSVVADTSTYATISLSLEKLKGDYKAAKLVDSEVIGDAKTNLSCTFYTVADEQVKMNFNTSDKSITETIVYSGQKEITGDKVLMGKYKFDDFIQKNDDGNYVCRNGIKIDARCLPGENGWECNLYGEGANGNGPNVDEPNYFKPIGNNNFVCGGIISQNLLSEIVKIYRTVCLVLVVAIIIFGMLDFFKAITSDDADATKKATKKFTTRLVIVILISILPVAIDLLLSLFGTSEMKTCLDEFSKF